MCIPWRDNGCPHRRAAFAYVIRWWHDHGHEVVPADSDGPFNISSARNRAAAWAIAHLAADVLIFADADTIPQHVGVYQAVYEARLVPGAVYPHDHYWSLDEGHTDALLVDPHHVRLPTADAPMTYTPNRVSVSGVVVCSAASWLAVDGWDEEFEGWGGEDVAFSLMARDVLGRALRLPGHVWHLWHPRDAYTTSTTTEDLSRLAAYRQAATEGPHALRVLRGLP